ncbi:MAG: metallophosphoesterase [Parachlamydiaceae bacterium]|nr:metallophosphoesterase [Parachlamydiaceae bacterium]
MAVWAIADLHLSFGVPDKAMDLFGPQWTDHPEKIKEHWLSLISPDDLVLIAGDISWAMTPEQAKPDLNWIGQLPGTKLLIRGNHDYWWTSLSKAEKVLPPSMHLIQNNACTWKNISVAGARLWDTPEYAFGEWIDYRDNPKAKILATEPDPNLPAETLRLFQRELSRLETSLKAMDKHADTRIVMTHYPPIGGLLLESEVSKLLEKYHVDICVFGHLHNLQQNVPLFGKRNEISYYLTACDYLNFIPLKLLD